MNFQVFAKENCELCKKAQDVLSRAGVVPEVRYVEGAAATPETTRARLAGLPGFSHAGAVFPYRATASSFSSSCRWSWSLNFGVAAQRAGSLSKFAVRCRL